MDAMNWTVHSTLYSPRFRKLRRWDLAAYTTTKNNAPRRVERVLFIVSI